MGSGGRGMTANRSYAVVGQVQHAQGKPPAHHATAQQAPGHVGQQPVKHWSPEAVVAMSLVGVVGIVTAAVCVLLFVKLVRWVFSGTKVKRLRCGCVVNAKGDIHERCSS